MIAPTSWMPEHDAMLRDNFEKGLPLSYAEMAEIINGAYRTNYTRNSTIGRANRLGLKAAKPPRGPKVVPEHKAKTTPAQRPDIAIRKAKAGPKLQAKPFIPRIVDVRTENVTLLELAGDGCRWPSGEGPFFFCNRPCPSTYCGPHRRLAYTPERARVRTSFHSSTR